MQQKLGYSSQDRLLIVNADDFGMCHSANEAIKELLLGEYVSSATLMVPCGWSQEAANISKQNPKVDVGIHLTLTSEWEPYKWGPITRTQNVETLVTESGFFPRESREVELNASREQLMVEIINQVKSGMSMGVDPTHLDNHMGSVYGLQTGKDFLDIVLDVCAMFQLPFRLPRSYAFDNQLPPPLQAIARERIKKADELGIVILDHLLGLPYEYQGEDYASFKGDMMDLLRHIKPGISEIIVHPAIASKELKAITPHWKKRQMEYDLFRDEDIHKVIREENIKMITWRDLRELQRS